MRGVYFYGAGRTGLNLALYFRDKGIKVTGVYRRKSATGDAGNDKSSLVGLKVEHFVNRKDISAADIVFITTVDSAIADSCKNLVEAGLLSEEQVVCHCSGSLTSDILESSLKIKKASLHPAQSFSRIPLDMRSLESAAFVAEGDKEAIEALKSLVRSLPNPFYTIDKSMKPLYHAACTLANNYTVVLHMLAAKLLSRAGFGEEEAAKIFAPMLEALAAGLSGGHSFAELLTGPVKRGDEETVEMHLDAIMNTEPGLYPLFLALTEKCRELVKNM